jgi:hydroxymethylpyrimidine/phosphomethylpyrimidine kinase
LRAAGNHVIYFAGYKHPQDVFKVKEIEEASVLLSLGPKAVLVKGGHLAGEKVYDVLVSYTGSKVFESPRIDTRHTHGTGCTLASTIATGIAQGMDIHAAVVRARNYVFEAIHHVSTKGNQSTFLVPRETHAVPPHRSRRDSAGREQPFFSKILEIKNITIAK